MFLIFDVGVIIMIGLIMIIAILAYGAEVIASLISNWFGVIKVVVLLLFIIESIISIAGYWDLDKKRGNGTRLIGTILNSCATILKNFIIKIYLLDILIDFLNKMNNGSLVLPLINLIISIVGIYVVAILIESFVLTSIEDKGISILTMGIANIVLSFLFFVYLQYSLINTYSEETTMLLEQLPFVKDILLSPIFPSIFERYFAG